MRKEKLSGLLAIFILLLIVACDKDDTATNTAPSIRDKAEVYVEDTTKIYNFLTSHTFNYEAFNFGTPYDPSNAKFQIKFDTLKQKDDKRTPLIKYVIPKFYTDASGFKYKYYILKLREGKGDSIGQLEEAVLTYRKMLLDKSVFEEKTLPAALNLTGVESVINGTPNVVNGQIAGIREGLKFFKTATSYSEGEDGVVTYTDFGMGAAFVPSGMGYFSFSLITGVPEYSPLIITFNVLGRSSTDFDRDGIPSTLENNTAEGDVDVNTDGDRFPNYSDEDDDNDGVLTSDEIDIEIITAATKEAVEAEASNLPKNKFLVAITKVTEGNFEGEILVFKDENKNGIYDHLDKDYPGI